MKTFLLNIMLALAWAALLEEFSLINLAAGFGLGYAMLWLMRYIMDTTSYFTKAGQIFRLLRLFTWELILSNLRVAYSVLAPLDKMQPGIVAIPLDLKANGEITLLANMITLTPGTLSLDVSDDRRVLYVHGMHINDLEGFKQDIKGGFERVVAEAFE